MRILLFILSLIITGSTLLQSAESDKLPMPPSFGLSDRANYLESRDKIALEDRIRNYSQKNNVEIIIMVVSPEISETIPTEVLMKRIAQQWIKSDCYGIIVHTPGKAITPQITIGGASIDYLEIDPSVLKTSIQIISELAREKKNHYACIDTALTALSEQLITLRQRFDEKAAIDAKNKLQKQRQNSSDSFKWKIKILSIIAAGVLSVALLYRTITRWESNHKVVVFPDVSTRKRFCSPYSGGSGGNISLNSSSGRRRKE